MATPPAGKKPAPRKSTKKPAAPAKKAAGKAAPAPKRTAPEKAPTKVVRKPRAAIKKESVKEAPQLGLTEKQQRFVDEYLVDLNATQAAIRAGYSAETARQIGAENLSKPYIQAAISIARQAQQERTAITADMVLMEIANVALADARDLVEVKTGCCRCCYGEGHKYQRTVGEMNRDREAWVEKGKNPAEFDEAGGIGFNPLLLPKDDCPICGGDGQARTVLKDTRHLSPRAAALYAGAKQTKEGIEIKMHSKLDALEKLAKHLGLYEKDNQQKADPLAALLHRIAAGNSSSLLPVADDPEAPAAPAAPAPGGNALMPREEVPDGD
ncbi:terminase small subunit [Alicycliphilus denitrificans]|uniref:terminase small subunit n=1 Tax=Alicycliphilus denitrificans TaxID=179636 RepID=UPI000C9EFEF4|nr:terminase small subunit [Alicycliphilus denitrificans]